MTTPVRIGLLRLTDSAPVLLAEARGLFAAGGLEVLLSIEPSWANIADKLTYGLLDAAIMLPPLALACVLGLRGVRARLVVPMGISVGGNAIVAGTEPAGFVGGALGDPMATGRLLVDWMRRQAEPPRLAVVHAFSTHNLLLRYWIAACGGDPDRDMRSVAVAPEMVVQAVAEGAVAGFCAGAPWGGVAEERGAGTVLLGTSRIWAGHPEKCLAVRAAWAEANPDALQALLRTLLRAGRLCDAPREAVFLAGLMEDRLGLERSASLAALPAGAGPERILFHAHAAWFPWRSHAAWFAGQMQRWGWLDGVADAGSAAMATYRPDLLVQAARDEGLDWPEADRKEEGAHRGPWSLPATPAPLRMAAGGFCDRAIFGPNGRQLHRL
jgi:two-component system, oxyanion-binding sensor